jgi:hypothetical protein
MGPVSFFIFLFFWGFFRGFPRASRSFEKETAAKSLGQKSIKGAGRGKRQKTATNGAPQKKAKCRRT